MFHNKMVHVIFFSVYLFRTAYLFFFCSLKRRVFKTRVKGELVIKAKTVLSRSVFQKKNPTHFKNQNLSNDFTKLISM